MNASPGEHQGARDGPGMRENQLKEPCGAAHDKTVSAICFQREGPMP